MPSGSGTTGISKLSQLDDVNVPAPAADDVLYWDDAAGKWQCKAIPSTNQKTTSLTFIIDGGGSAITIGEKGHLEIPFACTLKAWTLMADVAGAIVIDVWKDTYANFPPTDADAMPGAGKEPTIAATNQKAQDTDITDWVTTAIAAGDILAFNVDSCATITKVTISLKVEKS